MYPEEKEIASTGGKNGSSLFYMGGLKCNFPNLREIIRFLAIRVGMTGG